MLQLVESIKNKKIKKFAKLKHSKKELNSSDFFVLEGFRSVQDILETNVQIESVFLTPAALCKFESINSKLVDCCNLTLISEEIAQKLSMVKQSQGVFAVIKKLDQLNFSEIDSSDCVLVLVQLSDPGNVGTLIRSASAFNFNKVILIDCCNIYNPKVVRSTMGSIFKVKFRQCSQAEAITWLKKSNLKTFAAVAKDSAEDSNELRILKSNSNDGCVLVIGNEAHGISSPILSLCSSKIKINMFNKVESLNAAVAGSILMFNISRKINKVFYFK